MNSDTISRQAVLNATSTTLRITGKENAETVYKYIKKLCDDIKALPPTQPDVIRCKDCKWYGRADKRRFYRGMDCLKKRIDTIVPDRDFCSKAERREK